MSRRLVVLLALVPCAAALVIPCRHGRRRPRTALRMGWGDPPVWTDSVVKSNDEAGKGLRAITVEVSPETLAAHGVGGQYVQLTVGEEKAGFYAIASPPGGAGGVFEFLIKENDGNSHVTSLAAGATIKCSEVNGKGYQTGVHFNGEDGSVDALYDGFGCMNHLFVAGGSGIAPIRSTIESGIAKDLPKPAKLYYGVQDASVMAYADKFDAWQRDFNVEVRQCHSKASGPGIFNGYVQAAMQADTIAVPRNTGACVCGPKEMYMAVKDVLTGAGVFETRVLSNF